MADVNINLFKKIEENTTETDGFPEGYLIASIGGKVQGVNPDDIGGGGGGIDIEIDENAFDGDGSIANPYTLKDFGDGKQYANVDGAWVEVVAGVGGVVSVQAGSNISVDNTDPANPIVTAHIPTVTSSNKLYIFNNLGRTI